MLRRDFSRDKTPVELSPFALCCQKQRDQLARVQTPCFQTGEFYKEQVVTPKFEVDLGPSYHTEHSGFLSKVATKAMFHA